MADEAFDPSAKREPGPPEAYVSLALIAMRAAQDGEELREWWKDEAERRRLYGLSEAQEKHLIEAARELMATLPGGKPKPKKKTRPKRSLV